MREELEKLIAEATPGPWEVDTIYNEDGCYSGGGGCGQGFNDYAIYAPIDGKAVQILDTSYSDDKLIEEEFGEDGKIAWDCIGKANAALIVFLVNNAPAILEALTERASMAENEPAFPVSDCAAFQYPGMSLRDWFAGQTIGAIIAATSAGQHYPGAGRDDDRPIQDKMAHDAYAMADAMIAARKENTDA